MFSEKQERNEKNMPYREKTDTQYKNDYAREKYDRIALQVPKGQRDEIRKQAENVGESLNAFIYKSIVERIAKIQNENGSEK